MCVSGPTVQSTFTHHLHSKYEINVNLASFRVDTVCHCKLDNLFVELSEIAEAALRCGFGGCTVVTQTTFTSLNCQMVTSWNIWMSNCIKLKENIIPILVRKPSMGITVLTYKTTYFLFCSGKLSPVLISISDSNTSNLKINPFSIICQWGHI